MSNFPQFSKAIKQRFDELSKHELFVTFPDKDLLWQHYLASFPEGTNPIYRVNTEHDCSCCRNFIKNLGNVVAVVGNQVISVWSIPNLEYPYDVVARRMHELVQDHAITGLFRSKEPHYGAHKSIERLANGSIHTWNHFHGEVYSRHQPSRSASVEQMKGDYLTTVQLFKRGLEELKPEAFDTVIDLINQNALYRGNEFLASIKTFAKAQRIYNTLSPKQKDIFVWQEDNACGPVPRFRNTVIGTLIQDLSEDVELEVAVKSFESKVAPTNYKRPTALITPRMVEDALKTIQAMDLEPALERRFAKLSDVSVNNVLWVDNSIQSQMRDGIAGLLMEATTAPRVTTGKETAEEISIDDFLNTVLPQASSMEILVKNSMVNNLMSITAPVHSDSKRLFKWGNDFAWSYNGNITDSIKEKVKKAGGNISAKLRFSLAWFNFDDLDIHVNTPNGNHIFYGNRYGCLDVDMNAGRGSTREPVENVSFSIPEDGVYLVKVNQFSKRETKDVGFIIETESNGKIEHYSYNKPVVGTVNVGIFTITKGEITKVELNGELTQRSISQTKWGINTEQFIKVNTVMNSPNHWDDNQVGSKHWFFILQGCNNDEPTRGIYNEFLDSNLDKHRKVFEVLGNKTMCQPTTDQLSGVGFTSARGDSVTVRVSGNKLRKTFNIQF